MRSIFLAAALLAAPAFAQRQTLADPDNLGFSVVISVATDRDGDPTATRTLSTITPAVAGGAAATTDENGDPIVPTTTARRTTARQQGIQGAPPPSGDPMTATTYNYRDGNGEEMQGTWRNSFVSPDVPTVVVPEGTIQGLDGYQSSVNDNLVSAADATPAAAMRRATIPSIAGMAAAIGGEEWGAEMAPWFTAAAAIGVAGYAIAAL